MLEVNHTSKKPATGAPCARCHSNQYTVLDGFLAICNSCRKICTVDEALKTKRMKIIWSHGARCERCGLDDTGILELHHAKGDKRLSVLCPNCHTKLHKAPSDRTD